MNLRPASLALLMVFCAAPVVATAAEAATASPAATDRAKTLAAMKRATTFMVDKVGHQGGYVWSYLPDLSRRWGEMEAFPTMIWMQSPGSTEDVGNLLLDAYHATGDEYYYQAAVRTADALISVQLPSGGWNYIADLAGEASLKKWYDTIGKNGWRLEEFQHYYGNGTFDDSVSTEVGRFILRIYLEKRETKFKASLNQIIQFVRDSQYANGGWPQRYPPMGAFSKGGLPDYTGYVTFNDSVVAENVDFLLLCYQALGDQRLLDPIRRGMNVYVTSQQPKPQAGWGLQHTPDDLKPAGARTYEPKALTTHTTGSNISELIKFYYLTGDKKFLARVPEALDWLDSVKLPANTPGARGAYPTFVEVGTNQPLYIHRTGSNVVSGRYYADGHSENTIGHYSSFRNVDVAALRARYEKAVATPPEVATKDSPLRPGAPADAFPRILGSRGGGGFGRGGGGGTPEERATQALASLNSDGFWPMPLRSTSHPYKGDAPKEPTPGDFSRAQVGDDYDTSPYNSPTPVTGISTAGYIRNMSSLIGYLETKR